MPQAIAGLGSLYGRTGERDKAEKVLQEVAAISNESHITSIASPGIYAGLGDREKFFECMNRAYEEHSPLLFFLKTYPEYDAMRSDPRYDELLRRIGLA